jgi:hypothetical protein
MRKADARDWLQALRVYSATLLVGNLLWEIAQLPLYRLWDIGTPREIALAVAHCTAGDLLIGTSTLILALMTMGDCGWPQRGLLRVAVGSLLLGLLYTLYSEWLNVEIRRNWQYTAAMPRLPGLGTGLAPLAQWFVVPALASWRVARRFGHLRHAVD